MIKLRLFALFFISAILLPSVSVAQVNVTIVQSGADVVMTATGTINTNGLTAVSGMPDLASARPLAGRFVISTAIGWNFLVMDRYSGVSGPATLGTGDAAFASSGSGSTTAFGIDMLSGATCNFHRVTPRTQLSMSSQLFEIRPLIHWALYMAPILTRGVGIA